MVLCRSNPANCGISRFVASQAQLSERTAAVTVEAEARQTSATQLRDALTELAAAQTSASEAARDRDRAREQHADAQKQVTSSAAAHGAVEDPGCSLT